VAFYNRRVAGDAREMAWPVTKYLLQQRFVPRRGVGMGSGPYVKE